MKHELERRSMTGLVETTGDEKFEIRGIAASYNTPSRDLGGFVEKIAPGAFSRSLREGQNVFCLHNHSADHVLGATKSGTLKLSDSPEGLRFVCKLDRNNSEHRNIFAAVKRQDVNECSFAFKVNGAKGESWENRKGKSIRVLKDVDLYDVSVCPVGAYPSTSVSARSVDYRLSARDIDAFHRAEARRQEIEILRDAPGYRIIHDGNDIRVVAMSQREAEECADAELALRVRNVGEQLRQDELRREAKEELAKFREELGL
jgi:Escherichia/Staphylococcus phage prohead protease